MTSATTPTSDPAIDPVPAGYAEALAELDEILDEIEDADVDVDLLASRVTRAAALIQFCRDRIVAARDALDGTLPDPD